MKASQEKINICNNIIAIVSKCTEISVSDILSPSRLAKIVQARHLSMYFCRFKTEVNTKTIASLHGRDNHATVLHACKCIHKDLRYDKDLKEKFSKIEDLIK